MTHPLSVVPTADTISTGVRNVEAVAAALADVLADTYRLVFKSHAYHWNIEGPLFLSFHQLTEEHYEDMFQAADVVAERIRALGQLAPMSMADIVSRSHIEDLGNNPSAGEMVDDLVKDHERVAHRLHALVRIAGSQEDPVTEDLATERAAFHEKAAWMLRAMGKS